MLLLQFLLLFGTTLAPSRRTLHPILPLMVRLGWRCLLLLGGGLLLMRLLTFLLLHRMVGQGLLSLLILPSTLHFVFLLMVSDHDSLIENEIWVVSIAHASPMLPVILQNDLFHEIHFVASDHRG